MQRVRKDVFLDLDHNIEVLLFAKVATITRQNMFKASRFSLKGEFTSDYQSSSVSDFRFHRAPSI